MSYSDKLGANIRSLRMAYGETQEQLGEAIYVEKNTVSNYENGKRQPNKETLNAIAKHFMVSVEELLNCDLTSIGTINVDKDAFWKNIDIVFPIVSSEKAQRNKNFKRAYDAHKAFYEELHKASMEGIDNTDVCIDGYLEAIEDDNIEAEAAANFIAIWYLFLMCIKTCPVIMNNKPAALIQVAAKDKKYKKILENTDSSFESEARDLLNEVNDDEMKDMLLEMLNTVKKSTILSDLAYYYLALQYVYNLVDNGMDWGFNRRVGVEMMDSLVTMRNIYAARFIKYSLDSLKG